MTEKAKRTNELKMSLFFLTGCPSPVAYNEYCWMPCPENCEECYPGTGFCVKCKPGYSGDGCTICMLWFQSYI